MTRSGKQALTFWWLGIVVVVVTLYAFLGAPGSAHGAGEVVGRAFAHSGMAALFTWLIARRRTWSWVKFGVVWFLFVFGLAIVTTAGRLGST